MLLDTLKLLPVFIWIDWRLEWSVWVIQGAFWSTKGKFYIVIREFIDRVSHKVLTGKVGVEKRGNPGGNPLAKLGIHYAIRAFRTAIRIDTPFLTCSRTLQRESLSSASSISILR